MIALQQLRRAPKYVFDLGIWLWRTRSLVWVLLAIGVALLPWVLFSCLEQRIRFLGMGLQLIGVALVVVGLIDTRRAFEDQPTTWQGIKQWLAGRPRFRPKSVILAVSSQELSMAVGCARGRVSPWPDASLEHRVAILEREYAQLFDEVGKLSEETKQKIGDLSNAVAAERSERQQGEQNIKDQLKKAIAEGLPLGRVGAIGIISASASLEIAGRACPP